MATTTGKTTTTTRRRRDDGDDTSGATLSFTSTSPFKSPFSARSYCVVIKIPTIHPKQISLAPPSFHPAIIRLSSRSRPSQSKADRERERKRERPRADWLPTAGSDKRQDLTLPPARMCHSVSSAPLPILERLWVLRSLWVQTGHTPPTSA